jgi:hypothetical protein
LPRSKTRSWKKKARDAAAVVGDGAAHLPEGGTVSRAVVVEIPDAAAEKKEPATPTTPLQDAPLFADLSDGTELSYILISREGPVHEGNLGRLAPHEGEEDIRRRWGGGHYRIQPRNVHGRVLSPPRDLHLAGPPILSSAGARKAYEDLVGEKEEKPAAAAPAPGPAFGLQDVLAFMQSQQTAQQQAHQRELERLRAEADIREKERRAEDERRRQDVEDRDERRRAEQEDARTRDREFHASMLKWTSERSASQRDPVELLLAGIKLAQSLQPGPEDPLTALMSNLPAVVSSATRAAAPAAAPALPAARNPAPPRKPPAPPPAADRPDELTLVGPLGLQARKVVAEMQARGLDPVRAMQGVLEAVMAQLPPPPAAAAAPPPPPPAPAPSSQDGRPPDAPPPMG